MDQYDTHKIYLVAHGQDWVGLGGLSEDLDKIGVAGLPAFGTRECAQKLIDKLAKQYGVPAATFRIAEYGPTGNVFEG